MQIPTRGALVRLVARPSWPSLVICLAFATTLSGAGVAAPIALTLEQTQTQAILQAPNLHADALRVEAAREDAVRAGQLPDPRLVLALDNLTITGPRSLELGGDDMTMRRIGIMQDWPSNSKRSARRELANAGIAESLDRRAATASLVARAAGIAWVDCWVAEARLALLQDLHGQLSRAIALAEARLRGAEGGTTDVLATRAERSAHENELSMARSEIIASRSGLRRWLGAGADAPLAPPPAFDRLPIPAAQLRASLDRHTVLAVWDARERAAVAALQLARSEKRPDLSFGLSYGARSAGRADMLSLEVSVPLPLFTGNRQDRDMLARAAERDAIAADHDDARRMQAEALDRELARWQALVETTHRFRYTLLPLAKDRSAVALAAYGGGGELQPWLDAGKADSSVRLAYVDALGQLARSWLALATLLPPGAAP